MVLLFLILSLAVRAVGGGSVGGSLVQSRHGLWMDGSRLFRRLPHSMVPFPAEGWD